MNAGYKEKSLPEMKLPGKIKRGRAKSSADGVREDLQAVGVTEEDTEDRKS